MVSEVERQAASLECYERTVGLKAKAIYGAAVLQNRYTSVATATKKGLSGV
jgi:hypothetical protein